MARDIEARLRAFLDRGYRPRIAPHLVPADYLEEGYSALTGWASILIQDGLDPDTEPPKLYGHGWRVDAFATRPGQQMLVGGVFPTVEQALTYTEAEMEKYAPIDVALDVAIEAAARATRARGDDVTHYVGDSCEGGHRGEKTTEDES